MQTGSGADSGNAHGQPQQVPVQQVAQQQQQVPQQATQYRVAHISDESPTRVFDLRSTPTSPAGSIKVVQQFFIGDDNSEYVNGHVNVVVEPLPDGTGDPRSILLDSSADTSVFPLEFARSGTASSAAKMKLHDAQGREIPVICMRDLEMSLLDQHGQLITIKEHGAVSPHFALESCCRMAGACAGQNRRCTISPPTPRSQ